MSWQQSQQETVESAREQSVRDFEVPHCDRFVIVLGFWYHLKRLSIHSISAIVIDLLSLHYPMIRRERNRQIYHWHSWDERTKRQQNPFTLRHDLKMFLHFSRFLCWWFTRTDLARKNYENSEIKSRRWARRAGKTKSLWIFSDFRGFCFSCFLILSMAADKSDDWLVVFLIAMNIDCSSIRNC